MTTRNDTGVIRLHPADNVVVALKTIAAGSPIAGENIAAAETIPFGHKIATTAIGRGEPVRKYGQVIGVATADIAPGAHVHGHNLACSDLRGPAGEPAPFRPGPAMRDFMGYKRADGRVGTRNYVAVLSTVNCAATLARGIAERASRTLLKDYPNIDGLVPIVHSSGCGMASSGEGYDLLARTLWGTANNPNFAAVLVVGLGCEVVQIARLQKDYAFQDGPAFQSLTLQDAGGTTMAIEAGLERLQPMLPQANAQKRSRQPAGALSIGLQCGGSDAWSGITANPALGHACDLLVAMGGTAILSETPEIYGAEHLLYARAHRPEVTEKLRERIIWWKHYTDRHGMEMDTNPSPGNKAGGITTILEKSLGAVAKAGTAPLMEVVEYAQPISKRGLVFMDSPGFDPCSVTGQVASGANLIAFTTGRGSAFGCKPVPSIKLASNSAMFERMKADMDFDCGPIAEGAATIEQMGEKILDLMLETASGRKTKSEECGYGDNEFVPWHIGAVM